MAINEEFFEQDKEKAKKTLRSIQPVTILRGETLYRFASTTWHPHFWFASPWWLSKRTYQHIHKQLKLSIIPNWTTRTALGVKVGWKNKMDLIVSARVLSELRAWSGRGKPQYERSPNGIRVKWGSRSRALLDVKQYFIPGISDDNGLTKIGRQALEISHEAISIEGKQPW